ncbi:hypothetical protein KK062_12695 [Fulvivirgaceae bacterium PWU5]|uniref:Uncharacterized protein n=1 Tax=Dawidia cretensis TaxID=2782350 RepID=A0AAP2GVI9_9BACT|nr:hypothetical protein [Dawidia cretensis]MBT1709092.1 hypothetical protein [Dawidia cretensis]
MSKKKNTLRDLDEFLKQQAATLVTPSPLSRQLPAETPAPVAPAPVVTEAPIAPPPPIAVAPQAQPVVQEVTADSIDQALQTLYRREGGPAFRRKLYDIILRAAETSGQTLPEDKMLINTVLYLKSGDQWKETIRTYWRNK